MAQQRRQRLAEEAQKLMEAAEKQPLGSPVRKLLLRRARQVQTAGGVAMPNHSNHIYPGESDATAEQNARMREMRAKALELLRAPFPDTFLGRKTQEPFPKEDQK